MVSTNFGDESHVMRSIEAGAAGYLLKHAESASLASEIRSISAGGSPISPLIARQMLTRFRQVLPSHNVSASLSTPLPTRSPAQARDLDTPSAASISLSLREQEVLELITKGFTADEIAKLMQVSNHTVLTFIRRIYRKLKVKSKAEAIYEARAQGLLN
jgi:DNA-binding NarL/FixJ family response regulator